MIVGIPVFILMAAILDSSTIVLANIYLIMGLQLALNWTHTDCNTKSYFFQLGFITFMTFRLFFHELHNNQLTSRTINAFFMFLLSGLLLALGVYQGYNVFSNSNQFYYNPTTKQGSEVCFQNRIVFVGEMVLIVLTVFKDIYFICFRSNNPLELEPK